MQARVGNKKATGKTKYSLACSTSYSLRTFNQNVVLGLLIIYFHMLPSFSSPSLDNFLL